MILNGKYHTNTNIMVRTLISSLFHSFGLMKLSRQFPIHLYASLRVLVTTLAGSPHSTAHVSGWLCSRPRMQNRHLTRHQKMSASYPHSVFLLHVSAVHQVSMTLSLWTRTGWCFVSVWQYLLEQVSCIHRLYARKVGSLSLICGIYDDTRVSLSLYISQKLQKYLILGKREHLYSGWCYWGAGECTRGYHHQVRGKETTSWIPLEDY